MLAGNVGSKPGLSAALVIAKYAVFSQNQCGIFAEHNSMFTALLTVVTVRPALVLFGNKAQACFELSSRSLDLQIRTRLEIATSLQFVCHSYLSCFVSFIYPVNLITFCNKLCVKPSENYISSWLSKDTESKHFEFFI